MKTEKFVMVPQRILDCFRSTPFFIETVNDQISSSKSVKEAFETLEDEIEKYLGKRKFSDFTTFRVLKTRHNKRTKK